LDEQTEFLESVHGELSNYESQDKVVDAEPVADTVISPTEVESSDRDSDSLGTATTFVSGNSRTTSQSQSQSEKIRMQQQQIVHVQRVVYSNRRQKRSQLSIGSSQGSSLSSSPQLSDRLIEVDEKTTPQITKIDVQTQIIDDFQDGCNKKQFEYPYQLVNGPNNELIISDRDRHQLIVFDENLLTHFTTS